MRHSKLVLCILIFLHLLLRTLGKRLEHQCVRRGTFQLLLTDFHLPKPAIHVIVVHVEIVHLERIAIHTCVD